ncbi:A/G-specific adenine glycosylase [Streptococcus sp. sy010]|uniref:A/G-specific adenine glycosylase n=1 Tax=Streptococcus sp. sy010 TaxID=2600148 RepID=UPI0011B5B7DC|nr:A/G-specific adenine glycosylase [Streptococcus sp. sy010]TWT16335.1 A/G-specific adenine glycosylase [Streptococcus sp. sy010]
MNLADYGIDMWDTDKIVSFRKTLLAWYDKEKRDLPWRRSKNPYHIWISEIMLQQTQVITVIPYYQRFLKWFPTISDLAHAEEELLLKAWEGLGYYSRVRNMQAAAQQIMTKFSGQFPTTYDDIRGLKGIGPYTAGAIASIAFDLPEPAVDGNVMRVIARLFEVDYDIGDPKNRKIFQHIMKILIDPKRPGDFNQALMDLGTDIESAKNPRPEESPIRFFSAAYLHGTMDKYPIKKPKKKPRPLQLDAFIITNKTGHLLLEKKTKQGLLAGFWSFPLLESQFKHQLDLFDQNKEDVLENYDPKATFSQNYQLHPDWSSETFPAISHTFSHQKWHIELHSGQVETESVNQSATLTWVALEQLEQYPMATAQKKMLASYLKICNQKKA